MSKRITKSMAEAAAHELTKIAFDKKVEKAENDLKQLAEHFVRKYIPEEVREVAVTHLEAYEHTSRVEFTTEGNGGYNYKYVRLSYEHPQYKRIQLSIDDWRSLEKADKHLRNMQDARRDYDIEVQTALFNLRTERNVTDQFPEALPFLNFTECTALAPNLTPLRALLNQNL